MPGAFPESQYRQKIRANRSTQKLQLTRARSPQSGRTLFFDLYPFCYPFLGVGLGLGDACACDQGHGNHLFPFTGDGLGLATPFLWLGAISSPPFPEPPLAVDRLPAT